MKKSVYIETSVISYLAARPSRDLLASARQQMTVTWWQERRHAFALHVSELVLTEIEKGNPAAAKKRQEYVCGLPGLTITDEVIVLAERLVRDGGLPEKAADDALHVAVAAVNALDYLLTWNCRHIDNAETKPQIRTICMLAGYQCPEICTPEELMGRLDDE